MSDIVLPSGGYAKLKAYDKAETIYQATAVFCRRFLPRHGDRTVDQMIQAARSCKQNIAEGSAASGTSKETEVKLTGVALATLDELREDYLDYLKRKGLGEWPLTSPRKQNLRRWTSEHNTWEHYRALCEKRTDEVIANVMITVIHQEHALLRGLLAQQEADFKAKGGIRERMSRARNEARADDWSQATYSKLFLAKDREELAKIENEMLINVRRTAQSIRRRQRW